MSARLALMPARPDAAVRPAANHLKVIPQIEEPVPSLFVENREDLMGQTVRDVPTILFFGNVGRAAATIAEVPLLEAPVMMNLVLSMA